MSRFSRHEVVEASSLIFWLLKDASWCILFWPLGIVAAVLAILSELRTIAVMPAKESHLTMLVHEFATIFWLMGNAMWMIGEQCFDTSMPVENRPFWYWGPLVDRSEEKYIVCLRCAQILLGAALTFLPFFYLIRSIQCAAASLAVRGESPQDMESFDQRQTVGLVFGVLTEKEYMGAFIGPWILKDFCWTMLFLWPGLYIAFFLLFLMLDYCRRSPTAVNFGLVCWLAGNSLLMWTELSSRHNEPGLAARLPALAVLVFTCLIMFSSLGCPLWGRCMPGRWRVEGPQRSEGRELTAAPASTGRHGVLH